MGTSIPVPPFSPRIARATVVGFDKATLMFCSNLPQPSAGHCIPLWEMVCNDAVVGDVEERPWNGNTVVHSRQRSHSGEQDWKRTESGICDSRGWISVSCCAPPETVLTRYLEVSRPRQAAKRVTLVPLMGAQRRSTGGRICLWR